MTIDNVIKEVEDEIKWCIEYHATLIRHLDNLLTEKKARECKHEVVGYISELELIIKQHLVAAKSGGNYEGILTDFKGIGKAS